MSQFKYQALIKCPVIEHTREIHVSWLKENVGSRFWDWMYTWYEGEYYTVYTEREEDILAFRLKFKCESSWQDSDISGK